MTDRLHNNPPDPIDEAIAPFSDFIAEAEGWLDGSPVTNEDQMKAVDDLLKQIKAAKKAVTQAEESEAKPIYDAWKAAKARYVPTLTDLDNLAKGLVKIVGDFKAKLAAEKEAARKKAEQEAWEKTRAAQEAAKLADASNIEAQRAALAAEQEAKEAQRIASQAGKDTVKGMRKVTRYEITDYRAFLHWIAKNDKEAMTAFMDEYARRNHKNTTADGLRVWEDREAF